MIVDSIAATWFASSLARCILGVDMSGSNSRVRLVLLAMPALLTALVAGWTFGGLQYVGWFSDSIEYLWFADFYIQSFGGEISARAESVFRGTRFPPLLPLLLAAVGAGSEDPTRGAALMWALFVACSALATWWAWRETRSVAAACLAGLVLAVAPGWFLLQQISPVSEPLLLVLVLVALLLAGDGKFTRGRALAFALVVGAAPLSRSIGVALVVPAVVMLLSDRGLARLRLPLAALAVLPFAAWSMLRASLPQAESYMDQLSVESMRAAFGGVGQWLLGQPLRMIEGAATLLSITPSIPAIMFSALLGALALLACVVHWRRLDAQFLLLYCGIVFVWPFPAEMPRFMAVLFPVVIVLAARGGAWLLRRVSPSFPQQASGALVCLSLAALVVALPGAWQSATRVLREVDPALEPFKRTGGYLAADNLQLADEGLEFGAHLIGAIEELRDHVAPGECVYAVMPQFVAFYGKVWAVGVPRGLVAPERAREALAGCRYLFAISGTTPQYDEPPMYPAPLFGTEIRPLFVSDMQVDGVEQPVVALFDLASVRDEAD